MEAMNGFLLSTSTNTTTTTTILNNQDLAIRRFCPARVEQEQGVGGGDWDQLMDPHVITLDEIELWSPSDPMTVGSEEEELFVDSFFNMDSYEGKVSEYDDSPENHIHHQASFDELHTFSVLHNDVYGGDDFPMLIESGDDLEMSLNLCDDLGSLASEMVPVNTSTSTTGSTSLEDQACPGDGVDQGLHLVHLLLACAEAVGCRDTQLAASMLNQIWSSVSPWGDSLHRVSYCFAMGLKSRLSSLLYNVNPNGTFTNTGATDVSLVTREEKAEAFRLLHQTTPYISFGFMAANDAIYQAALGKDTLHIVDLGMEHVLQWPSLIRTLASRTEGPPKLVRITAIVGDDHPNLYSELESNMKRIIDEATFPLEFCSVAGPVTPMLLTRENLDLREGEALFVNSIMHLHKFVKESRGSLKTILQAIKKLGPTLLTVVEQDANHNGPFFLGRFLESLHYYSAIFDSLEASLARNSSERMKIEKLHFAEEIRNIVAYEGSDRMERHERADQWRRQLGRAGYQVVGLKCTSQARMMVSVYGCDGYTLASEKGCLLLGWKGRPIMLASAWQLHQ